MVTQLLLHNASGLGFLVGGSIMAGAVGLNLLVRGGVWRGVLMAVAIVGVALTASSTIPLPTWCYGVWLLWAPLAMSVPSRRAGGKGKAWRCGCEAGFLVVTAACLATELPFHLNPKVPLSPDTTIYVIGDSLSAGIGREKMPWPEVLATQTDLKVVNLATAGAKIGDTPRQVVAIGSTNQCIILEIGGNDVMGQTPVPMFRQNLDQLLSGLKSKGHQLIMFELPLPPFGNAYGHTQRQLAQEYDVQLIPRHVLTNVMTAPDATLDGIHLSQKGHDALAHKIGRIVTSP